MGGINNQVQPIKQPEVPLVKPTQGALPNGLQMSSNFGDFAQFLKQRQNSNPNLTRGK